MTLLRLRSSDNYYRLSACLALVLVAHVTFTHAWFEYCSNDVIYTVTAKDCPFGVLWKTPQDIGSCWYPQGGDHTSNVCEEEHDPDGSRRLQWIDPGGDDDDGPSSPSYAQETCKIQGKGEDDGSLEDKCIGSYVSISKHNTLGPGGGGGGIDVGPGNREDNDTSVDRVNTDVRNQTLRLFLYMNNLLVDENENQPMLRLVKLLKKSFEVLRTHCHTKYVTADFGKEIFRAFNFLLRESDLAHVKDITVVEYAKINGVLDRCVKGRPPFPFYLNGTVCKARTKIFNIIKTWGEEAGNKKYNKTHPFLPRNEFSFRWGKYDIPVDATWSVMDFTHGMCYGTFSEDMNSHHLYEQALERLFTPELQYRWARPVRLTNEFFWDNVFRSYTETSMNNLDACIQASYLGSPYLHRLARPINRVQPTASPIQERRKRSANSPENNAWCLTSQDEKDEALKMMKDNC